MRVIDLLNKIANGEETPKKIKYENDIYILTDNYCYYCDETNLIFSDRLYAEQSRLNDEVEIIEEKEMCHKCHKYPAEHNQTYCEFCLGISKLEEKKIPEKLGYFDLTKDKNEKDENGNNLELHYTGVADTFDDVYEKINEILDYLKNKGE